MGDYAVAFPSALDFLMEEDARKESASLLGPTIATMQAALR
jgi:hypothetical protein